MVNALLILPLFPEGGEELLRDEALLDSFVWELYRHNGPHLEKIAQSDVDIDSSAGENYRVKSKTHLFTILGLVQRDATLWKDPHVFKAERFLSSSEPLPVAGWGCPIGEYENEDLFKQSHQCVFKKLAHPFLKEYVKIIIRDFSFRLDTKSNAFMKDRLIEVSPRGTKSSAFILHVDYSIQYMHGGIAGNVDFTPKIEGKTRFSKFAPQSVSEWMNGRSLV